MRTVWKFPLTHGVWNDVQVGQDERGCTNVIHAGMDSLNAAPAVWIEHDSEGVRMTRSFRIFATGEQIPGSDLLSNDGISPVVHVGSVIDRHLVWHIYERTLFHG